MPQLSVCKFVCRASAEMQETFWLIVRAVRFSAARGDMSVTGVASMSSMRRCMHVASAAISAIWVLLRISSATSRRGTARTFVLPTRTTRKAGRDDRGEMSHTSERDAMNVRRFTQCTTAEMSARPVEPDTLSACKAW